MKDSEPKKKKRLFKRKSKTSVIARSRRELPAGKQAKKSSSVVKSAKTPKRSIEFFTISGKFFKNHELDFLYILIPLILSVALYTLVILNSKVAANIGRYKLISSDSQKVAPYPIAQNPQQPEVSAKAAIILDAVSQKIIYSKNPNLLFSMASTVKIMTALTALDYYKKDSVLTIKAFSVEGSGLNLQMGDKFYFNDLLYAMLLPSANDAAAAIADNYPGGREGFIQKMNEKASFLHLANTHFADPIGLNDDGDYSTVIDIGRLGSEAMKNQEFAAVVGTQQKLIGNIYQTRQYDLYNLNRLLGTHGVNGIKTGTTEGAGEVLVTSAIDNGHKFIIVVMNSKSRFLDTESLLSYVSQSVQFVIPALPTGISN